MDWWQYAIIGAVSWFGVIFTDAYAKAMIELSKQAAEIDHLNRDKR